MKKLIIIFCLTIPLGAQAGFVAPDGNEWELRGNYQSYEDHLVDDPADTDWIWATLAMWNTSGLIDERLTGADLDAFEGDCDGSGNYCDGFVFDPDMFGGPDEVLCTECVEQSGIGDTDRFFTSVDGGGLGYRVAIRAPANVPEPYTLGLMMLGLGGLGLARRRQHQR